ncbi:formimidoylglutamase [soil metagenome]
MSDLFQNLTNTNPELFLQKNDPNDIRLGKTVSNTTYENSQIVIIGFLSDEGIMRSGGRGGAALAPDAIREQFYQLTPFGISVEICDLGNIEVQDSLENTHNVLNEKIKLILNDNKKIIVLGGGNDISYPSGCAMADIYGGTNWLGVNVDAHFDVSVANQINSETPFRQLLDEKRIRPDYFYEIGFQRHFVSPIYYRNLQGLGVNLSSLEQIRSRDTAELELREMMREKFINHSKSLSTFFSFDMSVVRSADAPGTTDPSPLGLRAGEFIVLVKFAASLANTRIIQFTEVNPKFDRDNRTTKLVAIGMHRFCSNL